jgi:hypothetical protein
MRDSSHDDDLPEVHQEAWGNHTTMVVLGAWVLVALCVALVLWFGLTAVLYGLYRLFMLPLELWREWVGN